MVSVLLSILSSRLFVWIALATPGIVFLVIPASRGELGADPLKELFHRSGEIAVWMLGAVLSLSPLKTLFPRNHIVSALNRHRRSVGVTAFLYALLHVNFYFTSEGDIQSYFATVLEPFFLAGTTGFLILCLLTATSNDWSVRRMGFALWKWIHRLAYLAALVLFYHQGTAGKGNWSVALALFIPVAALESLRIGKLIMVSTLSRSAARKNAPAWIGWREFVLDKRVSESESITSFYLRPKDGRSLRSFRPGQFLTVRVEVPGQAPAIRTYTLSDAPNRSYFRLSIKREHHSDRSPGLVSNWFHDHFQVGDELLAKAPAGEFYLDINVDQPAMPISAGIGVTPVLRMLNAVTASRVYRQMRDDSPVVLISAGVGVTPMICMLNALAGSRVRRPVFFLHGVRARIEHAFASHVRSLARIHENIKIHVAYSRPRAEDLLGKDYDSRGRIGIETIRALVPSPYGDFFLCGPSGFIKEVYEDLAQWGVELGRIHFEFFGPSTASLGNPPTSNNETHQISFYPNSETIAWDGTSTLLDLAVRHGFKPSYGCRSGVCGTCACKLLRGRVSYIQTPVASTAKGTILLCIARPDSDVTLDFSQLEESRAKESRRTGESAPGLDYRSFRPQS